MYTKGMRKHRFTFAVNSEYVVVGTNPEFSDFDNPRGEIIRERFFMLAEDSTGRRFRYGCEDTELEAEIVFVHFAPAVDEWLETHPAYGSEAYISSGTELNQLRSEMEDDLGADWINHPQVSLDTRTMLF